ncbi:MAG: acetoacetate--CoA ligase [Rhodocyclaceae bacterium]|nr:acetoacetate--CoA ligase [Rhodocyclaceae bacterium]
MLNEGDILWRPSPERAAASNVSRYMAWLRDRGDAPMADYEALWQWSVDDTARFWGSLWDYFGLQSPTPWAAVRVGDRMPGVKWFPGARINFAEQVLARSRGEAPALYYLNESDPLQSMSWNALARQVRTLAAALRRLGVQPGDRVAAWLPNTPQAAVAMLASAAVGAIWSSCSPDFGVQSVLDRFSQIAPKVLFGCEGYAYGGKRFERGDELRAIVDGLPSLDHTIFVPVLDAAADSPVAGALAWSGLLANDAGNDFAFEPVPFEHPLWIVYSSGTTGLPKPIVHGHGGIVLEMLKLSHFHFDLHPGDTMFFFSTTGWVMWNIVVSSLLSGASAVLYDGNPAWPGPDVLWRMAAESGTTFFGASPTYVGLMMKHDIVPKDRFDLSRMQGILLGGSPATPESMQWCYDNVKADLWVTSQSGGTDVATGFVGASPTLPVRAGEIQTRMLGVDVHACDDEGRPVVDQRGELVVRQAMPSMPLFFWGDDDGSRYRDAYFDVFPGLWRHGDYLTVKSRGGCIIHGRSDSTLNRYGVRIGTAEVYRAVEATPGVADSLVVNLDLPGGRFFMPLFVRLDAEQGMDEALAERIRERLRAECSPRHVPDAIFAVDAIPYTLTGKKLEVPVRKILMGAAPDKVANRDAMANPASLAFFIDLAARLGDDPATTFRQPGAAHATR